MDVFIWQLAKIKIGELREKRFKLNRKTENRATFYRKISHYYLSPYLRSDRLFSWSEHDYDEYMVGKARSKRERETLQKAVERDWSLKEEVVERRKREARVRERARELGSTCVHGDEGDPGFIPSGDQRPPSGSDRGSVAGSVQGVFPAKSSPAFGFGGGRGAAPGGAASTASYYHWNPDDPTAHNNAVSGTAQAERATARLWQLRGDGQ